VKLWNVGRFISMHGEPAAHVPVGERALTDRWVLSHLAQAAAAATAAFDSHDYMQAYQSVSRMFWSVFCDRYIEMVKDRLGAGGGRGDGMGDAARCTLREVFRTVLGLFAPFVPFVTEELYQRFYASQPSEQGQVSLHLTRWPAPDPAWLMTGGDREAGDAMATVLDAVRALRSEERMGSSARLSALLIGAESAAADALLARIGEPLRVAARADALIFDGRSGHPSGVDGLKVGIRP
jgi:valyl-tRNA synthetase